MRIRCLYSKIRRYDSGLWPIRRVMKHRHSSGDLVLIGIMKWANRIGFMHNLWLHTCSRSGRLFQMLIVITFIILGLLRVSTVTQISVLMLFGSDYFGKLRVKIMGWLEVLVQWRRLVWVYFWLVKLWIRSLLMLVVIVEVFIVITKRGVFIILRYCLHGLETLL